MDCGCGRSPTGKCVGWHSLTEEQYQQELQNYEQAIDQENGSDEDNVET
tara:strand:- start:287 stop:433 length:147 start_codon:yes stop_codon:yes gene_type:complete